MIERENKKIKIKKKNLDHFNNFTPHVYFIHLTHFTSSPSYFFFFQIFCQQLYLFALYPFKKICSIVPSPP